MVRQPCLPASPASPSKAYLPLLPISLIAELVENRQCYEIVATDRSVSRRFAEWPYRYSYRFEAEHLLARAGCFKLQVAYQRHRCELSTAESMCAFLSPLSLVWGTYRFALGATLPQLLEWPRRIAEPIPPMLGG